MGRGVSGKPFDFQGKVDKLFDLFVSIVEGFKLRYGFECGLEVHILCLRYELCDPVNILIRYSKDSSDIADGAARGHGTEGNDLSYMVAAVFILNILNDLGPAFVAEVNIEIGHADALGVEKTLKNEVVFYRIYIGNAHRICRNARRAAAAAGTDCNTVRLGKIDEIPDDEVVIDKPHSVYNVKLIVEPVPMHLRGLSVTPDKSVAAELAQIFGVSHAVGCSEARQVTLAEFYGKAAFIRDLTRIFYRILIAEHSFTHLLLGLEVEFIGLHAHAVGLIEKSTGLYAKHNILRFSIGFINVMNIVCSNGLDIELFCKLVEPRQHDKLLGQAVILKLYIVILAEKLLIPRSKLFCFSIVIHQKQLRYFTCKACGKADEPFMVFFQKLMINPRTVIETINECDGGKLYEIAITLFILCKEDEMCIFTHTGLIGD